MRERATFAFAIVSALVACGEAKSPETGPLGTTRLEVTLDDATKPPPLDGRAFAVVDERSSELSIYVFDEKAAEPTCTDVSVGDWMEKTGKGSAALVRVARFSGKPGKYQVASIAYVRGGGGGKGRVVLRSASPKSVTVEVARWDNVFEATLRGGTSGSVAGIVCASK